GSHAGVPGFLAHVPASSRMFRRPRACSGMATSADLVHVGCARIMDPTTAEVRNPVLPQERPVEREKRTLFQTQRRNPEPGSMDAPIEEDAAYGDRPERPDDRHQGSHG